MAAAWPGEFGYFGTFSVDPDQQAVIRHIDGGWFPNLEGTRQVRHYHFQDGRLELDAHTARGSGPHQLGGRVAEPVIQVDEYDLRVR